MSSDATHFNSDATNLNPETKKQLVATISEFTHAFADSRNKCLTYLDAHPHPLLQSDDAGQVLLYAYNIANNRPNKVMLPAALKDLPDTKALIIAARREHNARQGVATALAAAGITDKDLNPIPAIETQVGQHPKSLDLNTVEVGDAPYLIQFSDLIHDHSFPTINLVASPTPQTPASQPHPAPVAATPAVPPAPAPAKPAPAPAPATTTQGKQALPAGERAQIAADKLNINESIDYLDTHHIKHAHLHKLLPPTGHDHDGAEKHAMHRMAKVTHGVALWRWMEHHKLHVHTANEFEVVPPANLPKPPAPKQKQ